MKAVFALFVSLLAGNCLAMASQTEFSVLAWRQVATNEFEITVVRPSGRGTNVLHIRFNPNRVTDLIQNKDIRANARERYDEASIELKRQLEQSQTITVWLLSDKGFIPIRGRPGHYRSDWMYLASWDKKGKRVCFVHSDLGSESPD